MLGLIAYPAMGAYKSVSSIMSPVQKQVLAARVGYDEWVASQEGVRQNEVDAVVNGFDRS